MRLLPHIRRVWAYVPSSNVIYICTKRILGITMERRCGQLSVTNCRNVGAMFPRRLSKIDDRCVDLRGSMVVVSTFEDR